MKRLVRPALATVAGLVVWLATATIGNVCIRALLPSYAAQEATMSFTLTAMLSRLALGGIACCVAAYCAASIASIDATRALGVVLLAIFVPAHIALWSTFPGWYHAVFLSSIVLVNFVWPRHWRVGRLHPLAT